MDNLPKKAFVVHGDPKPAQALADGLSDLGIAETIVPDRGDDHQV
jgi:hypothetical protein